MLFALLFAFGCAASSSDKALTQKAPALTPRAEAAYFYLKYRDLLHQDQEELAGQVLAKAIERDPSPELYLEQATHYWRLEEFSKVETTLRKGLDRYPGNRSLTLTLSRAFLDRGHTEKAHQTLNTYVANHPQDVTALKHLARLYLQMKEYAKARGVLKNIPEADWTSDEHYLMAQISSGLKNQGQTIKHLEAATAKNPTFAKAWAELGYQYELTKDYVAAEKAYTRLLDLDAANQEIYIRLIELNLKLNNPEQGLNLVQKGPAEQEFWLRALALFLGNEYYDQALRFFELFDGALTESPQGKFYKALTLLKGKNDAKQALPLLEAIQPGQAFYAQVIFLKSRLLWQQGDSPRAVAAAEQGQALFPDQERFWLLQSDILKSQGKLKQALAVLGKARKNLEDNVNILFQAGVLEYELGQRAPALELMERVLGIDADHAPAMNFIGYTLVEGGKDLERAFALITQALENDPDNGYFLDSLAWYYYQQAHFEKAWEVIGSALDVVEDDPVIWEHYAEIARKLDKMAAARKGYRKALELGAANKAELERKLLGL